MTLRQKRGALIILTPLSLLIGVLLIFYYSGFLQPEFNIWGETFLDYFVFTLLLIIGMLSILSLLVCLPLGIIYLTQPEKTKTELQLSPDQKLALNNQLTKTDKLILNLVTSFVANAGFIYILGRILRDNQLIIGFLKLTSSSYNNLIDDIDYVLMGLAIVLFVVLYFLFRKHFQIRQDLGQKGTDSLAEELNKFMKEWTGEGKDGPDLDL